ncbi:MAG: response regulator [Lentisphaerae bacterium]|nr:response regulator [Lentisphaerota bacterium]
MSKILVADDSVIAQVAYMQMLDFLGHEVIMCGNGLQAVNRFKETHPELVILDVDMPEMNGFDACREIRKTPDGLNVPIIIVSAGDSEEDIVSGMNAGANDYLVKPVKEPHLIAKLKTFLKFSMVHKDDLELVKNHVEFAGRYIIEKLLGHGAHSVVFLAKDKETGKHVAVFYIILEFADGGDLARLLKQRKLSEGETVKLALDLIKGLKEFEKHGIVHFDIKPENIMISGNEYKLGDFGIAEQRETATIPIRTEIWSTAAYLPPEYLNDSSAVSIKSDIYSLGITLYQAITGDNPFQSDKPAVAMFKQVNLVPPNLETYDRRITKYFSDSVAAMMDKNPDSRPSLDEIEHVFTHILEFLAIRPPEGEKEADAGEPFKKAKKELDVLTDATPAIAAKKERPKKRKIMPWLTFVKFGAVKSSAVIVLLVGLSIFAGLLIYNRFVEGREQSPPGALSSVICLKCQKAYETRIMDIKNDKCIHCGGVLAYRQKCNNCKFEFPYKTPDPAQENFKLAASETDNINKCPKCDSTDTYPAPTSLEKKQPVARK